MGSLRDQLLQKGLVSAEQAKQAEETARLKAERPVRSEKPERFVAPRPEGRRGPPERRGGPPPDRRGPPRERPNDAESRIPKLPPLQGSKEANRLASKAQVELDRKIRELVLAAQVPLDVGAGVFHFVTRKGKLRRLTLTEPQQKQLEAGELAVVERPDPDKIEHVLVPPATANQLLEVFPKAVRFFNRPGSPVGFLTEEEIHRRATEVSEPEESAAPAEAAPSPSAPRPSSPRPPADTETTAAGPMLTIRRSPLGEGEGQ
ncbi:MAG: DUF2058 family protein [Myxococcaceae bacterium]|nr:DUF2058 family protein [Myxococcaceae bacterium]